MHRRRVLTFREVLLGLATLEPCTQHGGMPAEMRCRYMFRYYDINSDGFLQFDEFRSVLAWRCAACCQTLLCSFCPLLAGVNGGEFLMTVVTDGDHGEV